MPVHDVVLDVRSIAVQGDLQQHGLQSGLLGFAVLERLNPAQHTLFDWIRVHTGCFVEWCCYNVNDGSVHYLQSQFLATATSLMPDTTAAEDSCMLLLQLLHGHIDSNKFTLILHPTRKTKAQLLP